MKQRPVVRAGLEGWRRPGDHRTTRHTRQPLNTEQHDNIKTNINYWLYYYDKCGVRGERREEDNIKTSILSSPVPACLAQSGEQEDGLE